MDNFENQIFDAIKNIRDLRQRPDTDRIFRTITKDAATNMSLADVQQKDMWTPLAFYQTVSKRIIAYVMQRKLCDKVKQNSKT